jgi:hypothetical protein
VTSFYDVESWDQDKGLTAKNNDLLSRVNAQVMLYQGAERVCANTINKLDGGTQWHAFTGQDDGASYGLDQTHQRTSRTN